MKLSPRPAGAAAIIAVGLGLTLIGCSEDPATGGAAPDNSPAATSSEPGDAASTAPPRLEGDSTVLSPGTYEFSFLTPRGEKLSGALVDVPSGWVDGEDWYVVSEDEDAFLGMWTTEEVRRDACVLPQQDDLTPGPGIADLADALAAQKSTRATAPEAVTFAGFRAVHLELTGPHDIGRCDEDRGIADVRGIYSDDQVDSLWIVDADGRRLVVDASFGPTATDSEREDLVAMVESVQVVGPDG